ncbi:hypothetical protein [Pseudoalteromonas luteoviolacea]|uniref:hypothetical protein n=1 Tax=Pseudoalteromonas luteoviolacea TaxID=43657 RepID=UPI0011519774|nr:hypothetical protein [Pseudoalteromonas luteoviolacea]TQF70110.1 hypothetical protein FLM44_03180 [Pseudoalteromonas luteoviolacea]
MSQSNEWFDLKNDIVKFMVPRLDDYIEKFALEGIAIPTWLLSKPISKDVTGLSDQEIELLREEWLGVLKAIQLAFQNVLDGNSKSPSVQSGLDLFSKYYIHLWD